MMTVNSSEIIIDTLAYGGSGVGRMDGKVCFVPFSVPGDTLSVSVMNDKRSYRIADIKGVIKPSQFRTVPECSLFGLCGGCNWQNVDYEQQLFAKRKIVADALSRVAHIEPELVENTIASKVRYGYRSRVQFKVYAAVDGLKVGFFKTGSYFVVDAPLGCPVADERINSALLQLRPILGSFSDCRNLKGVSFDSAENGVALIIHYDGKDLKRAKTYFTESLPKLKLVTALYMQSGKGEVQFLCGDSSMLYYSLPSYTDSGFKYRLNYIPGSFSQINRVQNLELYELLSEMLQIRPGMNLLDLYCGNGNFSLPFSNAVATVTGVESNEKSISAAEFSCSLHSVTNARYICADVGKWLRKGVEEHLGFDAVLLDPPRAGAAGIVPDICRLGALKIVYISCDPSTMARDCSIFIQNGYEVVRSVPVDMFPQTYHVESITLLEKR